MIKVFKEEGKMIIKNGQIVLFENEDVVIKNKDIKIENGIITKLSDKIENENDEIIDAKGNIVMPGLINTHSHIAMSIFRGTFEGCNLYTWLHEKVWPIEDNLTKSQIYNASKLSFLEMISTGTTCVNDQYFMPEETRKAAEEMKMRAVLTRPLMDLGSEEMLKMRIEEFEVFYSSRNKENDLISYTVSPHGLYTCSDKCLEEARNLAKKYNLPIHTHFLESIDEVEDIRKIHSMDAIDVLEKYFKDCKLILAHCVKANENVIEGLKKLNCGIAHNPVSNLRLGCKIADVTKYLRNNINVGLGTDGQGSGNNLDMFEAMKIACLLQGGIHENEDRITSKEAIKMATIYGAKVLGLDKKIGSIEIGKDADLIIVDIEPKLDNITKLPNNDLISNLVYNTSGRDVLTTIVKGKVLMKDRNILITDENEIISEFKQRML